VALTGPDGLDRLDGVAIVILDEADAALLATYVSYCERHSPGQGFTCIADAR
jgi:hypothetical protein